MNENIIFILMWLLLPIFWHYLLRVAGLSLFRVTIPSFVIVFIYVFQYIGLPTLYFQLDDYRVLYVTDKWLVFQVFLFTSVTVTLMITGFIAARYCLGPLNRNWGSCRKLRGQSTTIRYRSSCRKQGNFQLGLGIIPLVLISVTVLIIYLSKVGVENIALFSVLGFSDSELSTEAARSSMGNSFDGKYHWYKLFMYDLLSFSLFVIFAQYLMQKKFSLSTMLISVFFAITFLIATAVMIMGTQKGPMANLLIALFLVYVVVKKDGRIPVIKLVFVTSLLLFILCVFYIYFMNIANIPSALTSVYSRTFTGQIQPAYHYLDYFQNHEFLLGRSLPNPNGIFRSDQFHLTIEIMNWVHPGQSAKGVVGSMPTIFWGEMYANFGLLGVLIPPFFVGYGLYLLNVLVYRLSFTPLSVGLFVWLLLHYKTLSKTGLGEFLLDIYIVGVVSAFILLSICVGHGWIFIRRININSKV